jgi:hypothetical protein
MASQQETGGRRRKHRAVLTWLVCTMMICGLGVVLQTSGQIHSLDFAACLGPCPYLFNEASTFIGDGDDSLFVDKKPAPFRVPGSPDEPTRYTLTVDSSSHSVLIDLTPALLNTPGFYVIGGDIGFGTQNPESRLHLDGPATASDTTEGGVLRIEDTNGAEMVIDGNQIETTDGSLYLNDRNPENVVLAAGGGKVIVGKATAESGLEVRGAEIVQNDTAGGVIRLTDTDGYTMVIDGCQIESTDESLYLNARTKQHVVIAKGGGDVLLATGGGRVGIGLGDPEHELDVCGTIRAEEIIVQAEWCDFVFEPDYALMPLPEVERCISESGHLPGVQAAETLESDGVPLGVASSMLMQKIEELTLYIIEQDKRITELEQRLASLGE